MRIPFVAARQDLDYFDAQSLSLVQDISALAAWNNAMCHPLPGMAAAMWLRDRISVMFG